MILLIVNYKNEIIQEYFKEFDFLDIHICQQNKGYNFGLKAQKIIMENKKTYKMIIHFGICGGRFTEQIGQIYQINKAFLYYKDIIDSQKLRTNGLFFNIPISNIVTKFKLNTNEDKLYDFADIYDLETYWMASVSNFFAIPFISIKGVSDINNIFITGEEEIEYLLNENSNKKEKIISNKINQHIRLINKNFLKLFLSEIITEYDKLK